MGILPNKCYLMVKKDPKKDLAALIIWKRAGTSDRILELLRTLNLIYSAARNNNMVSKDGVV